MIRRPFTKSEGKYPGEQALEAMSGAAINTDASADNQSLLEGFAFFIKEPPAASTFSKPQKSPRKPMDGKIGKPVTYCRAV